MKRKIMRIFYLFIPPVLKKIRLKIFEKSLPPIDKDFKDLSFSSRALQKLIKDYKFTTVLDIGSGSGAHTKILNKKNKKVTALDFGKSIYAKRKAANYQNTKHIEVDFLQYKSKEKFDCIWASHVLEHQTNPGFFIKKCIELTKNNGIIAISVPPMSPFVVGGHLTYWNAGILLYNLVINGLDCRNASVLSYDVNISVIVRNKMRENVDLTFDNGDINKLIKYFPKCIKKEGFYGEILKWNW